MSQVVMWIQSGCVLSPRCHPRTYAFHANTQNTTNANAVKTTLLALPIWTSGIMRRVYQVAPSSALPCVRSPYNDGRQMDVHGIPARENAMRTCSGQYGWWRCCMDRNVSCAWPVVRLSPANRVGLRSTELGHPIQDVAGGVSEAHGDHSLDSLRFFAAPASDRRGLVLSLKNAFSTRACRR